MLDRYGKVVAMESGNGDGDCHHRRWKGVWYWCTMEEIDGRKREMEKERENKDEKEGWLGGSKDENIGNHGYISISILRIYRRYIDGYFEEKKYQ